MSDDFDSQSFDDAWNSDPSWSDAYEHSEDTAKIRHGRCLVASSCEETRDMLADAAKAAGWDVIAYSDADQATAAIHRERLEMAWIDVQDEHDQGAWKGLCEAAAGLPSLLLSVCGSDFEPNEEIWARQLGVWLYVPGIAITDAPDVTAICEEAQLVASHAST